MAMTLHISFAPGTYGTYLASCFHDFTELGSGSTPIDLHTGSSHAFRAVEQRTIIYDHELYPQGDRQIRIVPDATHYLDYFDNQFVKNLDSDLVAYCEGVFTAEEIYQKLSEHWAYTGDLQDCPRWILREFLSLCIRDCLDTSFSEFTTEISDLQISAEDIVTDLPGTLGRLCTELGIQITADREQVVAKHRQFLASQQHLGAELACINWALNNQIPNLSSPCRTIFDEAFVQYILTQQGYDFQCFGLDHFPENSQDLRACLAAF